MHSSMHESGEQPTLGPSLASSPSQFSSRDATSLNRFLHSTAKMVLVARQRSTLFLSDSLPQPSLPCLFLLSRAFLPLSQGLATSIVSSAPTFPKRHHRATSIGTEGWKQPRPPPIPPRTFSLSLIPGFWRALNEDDRECHRLVRPATPPRKLLTTQSNSSAVVAFPSS